jgi:hypothetical protein
MNLIKIEENKMRGCSNALNINVQEANETSRCLHKMLKPEKLNDLLSSRD